MAWRYYGWDGEGGGCGGGGGGGGGRGGNFSVDITVRSSCTFVVLPKHNNRTQKGVTIFRIELTSNSPIFFDHVTFSK